jgi:hypothetical protein
MERISIFVLHPTHPIAVANRASLAVDDLTDLG